MFRCGRKSPRCVPNLYFVFRRRGERPCKKSPPPFSSSRLKRVHRRRRRRQLRHCQPAAPLHCPHRSPPPSSRTCRRSRSPSKTASARATAPRWRWTTPAVTTAPPQETEEAEAEAGRSRVRRPLPLCRRRRTAAPEDWASAPLQSPTPARGASSSSRRWAASPRSTTGRLRRARAASESQR